MSRLSLSTPRAGFSLVETLIAMTLLALVLLSLAPLAVRASRGAIEANGATYEDRRAYERDRSPERHAVRFNSGGHDLCHGVDPAVAAYPLHNGQQPLNAT